MSKYFGPVIDKHGAKAVGDLTILAMGVAQAFALLTPQAIVKLIAKAPQADRDAAKTPRQVYELVWREYGKVFFAGLDGADAAIGSNIQVDLSCVEDLLAAIKAQAKDLQAAEDAEVRTLDPIYVVPGNGTIN